MKRLDIDISGGQAVALAKRFVVTTVRRNGRTTKAAAATEMTTRMAEGILQANGEVMVEPRLDLEHVVNAVLYMAGLPLDANVQFMTVMATKMPFIGRG